MAEYRRLISYIYEYEGTVKGKNVGFAKLEARNGMCRLNVNVKKIYMGGGEMGVYLLTGRKEIFLGNIFLRNGSGEFRSVVQVADIEHSGERMDECYGLTIHEKEDSWRAYTTIWEDAVAQAAQLTLDPITTEGLTEKQVEMGKVDRVAPVFSQPPVEEPQRKPAEEPKQPPVEEPQRKPVEEPKQPPVEEPQRKPAEEPEQPPVEEPRRDPDKQDREILTEEHEGKNDTESIPDFEMGQLEMETRNPDIPLLPGRGRLSTGLREEEAAANREPEPETEGEQEKKEPVIRQYREDPIIIGDPEALARLEEEDAETQIPVWDFLAGSYPKIQAFDSEHGCMVLVIKPKDIGLLPRETWIYGNNSFLLHGYYNYRYLILARLENPNGRPRYILGVPGNYYSNEKYMASMFGFPHFVLSKKQSTKDGRFGYWYTDVPIEI